MISFIQILDSRGNPTLQGSFRVDQCTLTIAVPSGASTGTHEAHELRDGGSSYGGKGVEQAVANAKDMAKSVSWDPANFQAADTTLLSLDDSHNKSQMGANAMLAVSLLQAKVQAYQNKIPLHQLISDIADTTPALPLPFANVINGGQHTETRLHLQEFMIVPVHAESFSFAVQQVSEVYHALKALIAEKYGGASTGLGDEGGFAPDIQTADQACSLLVEAMQRAGHDMAIAIDAAASEFYNDGIYYVEDGKELSAEELAQWYVELVQKYPIVSLEDPFDQEDFYAFMHLRNTFAEHNIDCQVVGDDLTVTNPSRIDQAIRHGSCDCLLLKINQIGTLSEALAASLTARSDGWNVMVSHRSGETEDSFIADLAVGLGCGQIKLGAPARGERTAKYNRLLTLESEFNLPLAKTLSRKNI